MIDYILITINNLVTSFTNYSKEFPYATWIWAKDTANLGILYEVEYIPKTVLIDPDGYIRFEHIGVTDPSIFITEIEELLS